MPAVEPGFDSGGVKGSLPPRLPGDQLPNVFPVVGVQVTRKYSVFRPTPVATAVAAVLGTTAIAGFMVPAHAQEAETQLEEVKVTGSRILRRDLDAPSPLVTVGTETFESSATVALETSLNKLPQFVPGVTQFVSQDVQNTATNTVGASTLNLRGLGANRNLVLLDGRRAMPINASLVVDINSIPAAAIKRIDIISGGASAAYGADAVGGVVNFILKNDFEGMEFDTQYGITEFGDDQELRVSGLMGGNFADNRGNAMFGLEYFKRGAAKQSERDFYTRGWADPTVPGTEAWFSDTYYQPNGVLPSQGAVDSIFTQNPGGVSNQAAFYFNKDNTIYTAGDPEGVYRYNGILDNRYRKLTDDGLIGENQLATLVSTPADRYSLFGRADYDVTDDISFFIQGNFTKTSTTSIGQYSPAVNGWAAMIPRDADHPIPDELATLLDSRTKFDFGTGTVVSAANDPWQLNRNLDFLPPRSSRNDNQTYQVVAGLSGSLPVSDWTWEAYVSHGNTEVTNKLIGFASLERFRAIVTAPNYGRGAVLTGNPSGNGFGAATVTCTSGLPIFEQFQVSQDCIDAITADLQNNTNMDQNVAEVNLQGTLVTLPAGDLGAAVGVSWRENTFDFTVDNLNSTSSFFDSVIGLFPAAGTTGADEVREAYAELLVPVIGDLPGVKSLNLELGYRFSDYDSVGDVDTYKALVNWSITDAVKFRGGYQRANRAPNIGELFLPPNTGVVFTALGDPCSINSLSPNGANPQVNPNAAAARAFCEQLMGPTGASTYYANQIPGTGFFPFALVTNQGNVNLKNEVADTLTAGFVFRPAFDSKLLSRFSAAIDWYQIDIDDTIAPLSFDAIYGECFATLDANSSFCQLITRDPTSGNPAQTIGSFLNVGKLKTSGVDLNVDWAADLADLGLASLPGSLGVNLAATYLDSFETQDLPTAPIVENAGTLAQGGQYRYKTYLTTTYSVSGVSASLRWRHLPSAHSAARATQPNTPFQGPSHYDIVDLNGTWEISESYQLRFGIENLFDTDPEITSFDPDPSSPTFTTGAGTTNAGFYDTLGRRYFVGFKARF